MPIYEFNCKACNTKFDHLARTMSDSESAPTVKCPKCGSTKTARALSVFAVASDSAGKSSPAPRGGGGCACGGPGPCSMG